MHGHIKPASRKVERHSTPKALSGAGHQCSLHGASPQMIRTVELLGVMASAPTG